MRPVRKLRELEKDEILYAIEVCDGDPRRAAEALGMHLSTVYRKLRELECFPLTIRKLRAAQGKLAL